MQLIDSQWDCVRKKFRVKFDEWILSNLVQMGPFRRIYFQVVSLKMNTFDLVLLMILYSIVIEVNISTRGN